MGAVEPVVKPEVVKPEGVEPGEVEPEVDEVEVSTLASLQPDAKDGEHGRPAAPDSLEDAGDDAADVVVAAVASEFHLAAHRDGELGLYPMSNDVMVIAGAQAFAEAAVDEPLTRRPGMTRGFLDPGEFYLTEWHAGTVGGRWPDSTWVSAFLAGQRWNSPFYVYYRKGERWQRKANVEGLLQWYYVGFARWTDGQTLALRVQDIDPRVIAAYGSSGDIPDAVLKKHAAALATATPRFDMIDARPGAAAPPKFPAGVTALGFTARSDGQIDAVVIDEQGALTLLRWPGGASEPRRVLLPRMQNRLPVADAPLHLVSHKDGSLWIGAAYGETSYLTRFDGEAWGLRTLPTKEALRSLSAGDDGVMWAVTGPERLVYEGEAADQGHLWRSEDGEKWRSVGLPTVQFADLGEQRWEYFGSRGVYAPIYGDPADAQRRHRVAPKQVWSGGGEVWVVGVTSAALGDGLGQYTREVVLRTLRTRESLELPSDNALRLELLDERPAKEYGFRPEEMCEGVNVVTTLMSLPADAPTSGPIEVVEKLLREHPELALELESIWEARHRGRRVIAFVAGGLEKPRVATVLGWLAAEVAEKRSFMCRLPIVVRPLRSEDEMDALAAAYRAAHPQP